MAKMEKGNEIKLKKILNKWFVFPDQIGGKFLGFESKNDETQRPGTFVIGQNVKFTDAHTPTLRDGYEVVGTEASNATPVKRAWVFERRDGVQIEMKAFSTGMYAWIWGVSTSFSLIKGGFTAAQEFGMANIGQSDQTMSWCFFCNGQEYPFRWTGAYGLYTSDNGSNQITVQGSTTLANLGFSATGTIIINGTEITYTGLSSQTFTGCSAVPSSPTVGDIIFQSPVELSGSVGGGTDPDKFSVAAAVIGRLHTRRESKKDVWVSSKLDNPDDIAGASANDGEGNAKEIEQGGPITAFGKLNKSTLCFKNRNISTLRFTQVGSRIDVYFYEPLVSSDDKSTTLGAVNQKSTFATPQGVVFTTPDKKMMLLTGVTGNNEPQYISLSDPIQAILDRGVHDDASGICFDNKIYYSFKETVDSTVNDVVIVGDLDKKTVLSDGQAIPILWDTPYIGWNVNDWTIIYNSTDKKHELHWHSSLNSNTYRMINDKVDGSAAFTGIIRSHAETFGAPHFQKKINAGFIEIKMFENSVVTATLLYDQDGFSGQTEYILRGTDAESLVQGAEYNPFGASAFGSQKIGSNPEQEEMKRYIFELEVNSNIKFWGLSLQLTAEEENSDFELVRYGFSLQEYIPRTQRKFKKGTNS